MERNEQGQFQTQDKPLAVIVEQSEGYYVWDKTGCASLSMLKRHLVNQGYRVQVARLPKQGKRVTHGF